MSEAVRPTISIGGYELGDGNKPMVVAELSGNHNGQLGRALKPVIEQEDSVLSLLAE